MKLVKQTPIELNASRWTPECEKDQITSQVIVNGKETPFIETPRGKLRVRPGDILVEWPSGDLAVMSENVFDELYTHNEQDAQ